VVISLYSYRFNQFGAVMPAKAMLFDQRVRTLHDFGAAPHNFISFNPQGRLVALAGFGNLAGKINVFDRRTLSKVSTIDAPNTSHCEWSPDGRFLLTATLSPRLRVDNGIRVWHCTGPLMHVQMTDDLYQAGWRPTPVDAVPQFGQTIPPAPQPASSVSAAPGLAKPAPTKPVGAYRPPGARGTAAPMIFRREDEGGEPRFPSGSRPTSPGRGENGHARYRSPAPGAKRHIPGAPPPKSPPPQDGEKKGQRKRKGGKDKGGKDSSANASGTATPVPPTPPNEDVKPGKLEIKLNGNGLLQIPVDGGSSVPPTPGEAGLDPVAKKLRNLNKKVRNFLH
jgi:translation initiation factor 2A